MSQKTKATTFSLLQINNDNISDNSRPRTGATVTSGKRQKNIKVGSDHALSSLQNTFRSLPAESPLLNTGRNHTTKGGFRTRTDRNPKYYTLDSEIKCQDKFDQIKAEREKQGKLPTKMHPKAAESIKRFD